MKVPFLKSAAAAVAVWVMAMPVAVSAQATNPDREYGYRHGPGMMWDGDHWGGHGSMFGLLFSLLVLLAIIALVIYLLRVFGYGPNMTRPSTPSGNALDILKERYARGEIDSKEFDERKRMLSD